jgi:hypothetical protein
VIDRHQQRRAAVVVVLGEERRFVQVRKAIEDVQRLPLGGKVQR